MKGQELHSYLLELCSFFRDRNLSHKESIRVIVHFLMESMMAAHVTAEEFRKFSSLVCENYERNLAEEEDEKKDKK